MNGLCLLLFLNIIYSAVGIDTFLQLILGAVDSAHDRAGLREFEHWHCGVYVWAKDEPRDGQPCSSARPHHVQVQTHPVAG